MPQHTGVEPWMRIWVVQVSRQSKPSGGTNFTCFDNRVAIFTDKPGHDAFIQFLNGPQSPTASAIIRLVHDYGEQRWFNDKAWIQAQLNDIYLNGNWIPDLQP
jgi:hypothetical protein